METTKTGNETRLRIHLLQRRSRKVGRRPVLEYMARWKGYSPVHTTHVSERNLDVNIRRITRKADGLRCLRNPFYQRMSARLRCWTAFRSYCSGEMPRDPIISEPKIQRDSLRHCFLASAGVIEVLVEPSLVHT